MIKTMRINGPIQNWAAALACAFAVAGFQLSAGSAVGQAFPVQAISAAQPAAPDSLVAIAADSQGLPEVDPADVQAGSTVWWVIPGGYAVPMPFLPPNLATRIYEIAPNQYLFDETGGDEAINPRRFGLQGVATSDAAATAAAAAEIQTLVDLITQIQASAADQQMPATAQNMGMNRALADGAGADDGMANGVNGQSSYALDPNLLGLSLTNVANGLAWGNLLNCTDFVYAVWSSADLAAPFAQWQIEAEVFPSATNAMPFTVLTQGWPILFLQAGDWTGAETNGLPCWWLWQNFKNLNETASTLDRNGNTLLYDFQNGLNPNVVSVSAVGALQFTNGLTLSIFEPKPQGNIP